MIGAVLFRFGLLYLFEPDAQGVADDGFAGKQAVACLLEVVGFFVVVHVVGYFVDPGQGMQDAQVWLALAEHTAPQDVDILHPLILHQVGEALALDAGHVDDVGLGYGIFVELAVFYIFYMVLFAIELVFFRHGELFWRNEVESRVEVPHGLQQGVHRPAILEVAYEMDVEVVERSLRLQDGIQVEHRLRGVLVGPVARIDDRDGRDFAGIAGRTFQIVPHDDEVGIVAYHHDGVLQALALGGTGVGGVGKSDDPAAQAVDGGLETQAGAGGWFEKQGGYDFSLQKVPVGLLFEEPGHLQEVKQLLARVAGNGNKTIHLRIGFAFFIPQRYVLSL